MDLQLEIGASGEMTLGLMSDGKAVDCLVWRENNDLSRTLLGKIDKILRKNKKGLDKISGYKIISDVPEKWTSVRIVVITFKSLKIACKKEKSGELAQKTDS